MKKYLLLGFLLISLTGFCQQKTVDKKLLVGKWVSLDDKRSAVVYSSTHVIDYYDGKKILNETAYRVYYDKGNQCNVIDADQKCVIEKLNKKYLEVRVFGQGVHSRYRRAMT